MVGPTGRKNFNSYADALWWGVVRLSQLTVPLSPRPCFRSPSPPSGTATRFLKLGWGRLLPPASLSLPSRSLLCRRYRDNKTSDCQLLKLTFQGILGSGFALKAHSPLLGKLETTGFLIESAGLIGIDECSVSPSIG